MNLASDPWIPVVHADGLRDRISLRDAFTAGTQYLDFDVRPHERIALMRLHVCIAQAALDGPTSAQEFRNSAKKLPSAVDAYFEKWGDRFELFHPDMPFLQRADISKPIKAGKKGAVDKMETTPTTKLVFSLATGNNSTLYDHGALAEDARALPLDDLAIALLTFQSFSPGGLISQLFWGGKETNKSSKHAPCTPSSMLHVFIRRQNILETISANLLMKGQAQRHFQSQGWGQPIWEMIPADAGDTAAIVNATQSYLGRLVPMPRFIRLLSDTEMLLGNGLDYPAFPVVREEPSTTVILKRDSDDRMLLGAKLDRALWRQLHAIGKIRRNGSADGAAATLQNLEDSEPCDIWVGAFLTDKATIIDTVESVFPLPANFRLDEPLARYRKQVDYVESVARRLAWAIETYRQHIDGAWESRLKLAGPKKHNVRNQLSSTALRFFWTAIETHRHKLVDLAMQDSDDDDDATRDWYKLVYSTAYEAYRTTCVPKTGREFRAFALGMKKLSLRVVESPDEPEVESDADDNDDEGEE